MLMIFLSMMGRRMPYWNLLTRIKSPSCKVGSIDPDGIRKGSTTNDRNTNTNRITGKKLTQYSTAQEGRLALAYSALRIFSASAASIPATEGPHAATADRQSTRLNSSH